MARRLVVGITGATGVTFGFNLIRYLCDEKAGVVRSHVILSDAAKLVCKSEMDVELDTIHDLLAILNQVSNFFHNLEVYQNGDIGADIASGSFLTEGMVILPCSMKTVSDIAYSRTEHLISRAADVTLKEGRRLVLCVRETPLHKGHLQNLLRCADMGAIIMPLVVALYSGISSVEDLSNHFIGRVLDLFNIHNNLTRRWKGE